MNKLLVFTDLDGTLLDHENYDWSAAQPALQRLEQLGFPLIFNTSKTLAELIPLSQQLNNPHPMICENGNVAAIPNHYEQSSSPQNTGYTNTLFGMHYDMIIQQLHQLRSELGFHFSGFKDLGVTGVMEQTGLDKTRAQQACNRLCSEPLLWLDDDAKLTTFRNELAKRDLTLTQGGRFYHVLSPVNKGHTMAWLLEKFQQWQSTTRWITVALGDGKNDQQMLEAADHPVLIKNPHSTPPNVNHLPQLISPQKVGPAGWNQAINQIIDTYI